MPHAGQSGVNQLGGVFVNGRPLPDFVRRQIVALAECGVRPCDISRQLLVSHGCVSKILSRYYETGSVSPGATGGQKAKSLPPLVIWKLSQLKHIDHYSNAKQFRDQLIEHRVYNEDSAPSISAIARALKAADGSDRPSSGASNCANLLPIWTTPYHFYANDSNLDGLLKPEVTRAQPQDEYDLARHIFS